MLYIECKEPGCTQIISSPCTPVNVLFGINALIQTMKAVLLDVESKKNIHELLEKVKNEVQDSNIRSQELKIDVLKDKSNATEKETNTAKQKVIILECILKHQHSYLVNCE